MAPRKVGVATPHLQDRIALDGGTLRLENADLFFDGVDVEVQEPAGLVTGSIRSYATQRRTLDLAFCACDDRPARGLERLETKRGSVPAPVCQAPLALDRAPHPLAAAGAMVVRGVRCRIDSKTVAAAEVELLSRARPGERPPADV
jgi:hypothetical protein